MSTESDVRTALSTFHGAQKAGDLHGMVAAFTEEGTSYGAPRTRDRVRAFFAGLVDQGALRSMSVDMERCRITVHGATATAGPVIYTTTVGKSVKSYDLMREEDGAWRIRADRETVLPEDLASFDDRWTMRYVRVFPAPIERVWKAVTTSEELNIWLLPVSHVEPKLGGKVSFTWGKPEDHHPQVGEVTIFEPPRSIRFQFLGAEGGMGTRGHIQFDLERVEEGTRFSFVHAFSPDYRQDQSEIDPEDKGGALPGGLDTPWRPGFVAGFHINFDQMGAFLRADLSAERIRKLSEFRLERANATEPGPVRSAAKSHSPWADLVEIYYDLIQKTCPPG